MPDILIATDAEWLLEDVEAAVAAPDTTIRWVRAGAHVLAACAERVPDLAIIDLQIGQMGGIAACMALRLEESGDRLPHVPVLLLLDRAPDVFLARRSGAEGWLIKPLDPIRLRRATKAVLGGGAFTEGVPAPATA